jgi:hypothetical protein
MSWYLPNEYPNNANLPHYTGFQELGIWFIVTATILYLLSCMYSGTSSSKSSGKSKSSKYSGGVKFVYIIKFFILVMLVVGILSLFNNDHNLINL